MKKVLFIALLISCTIFAQAQTITVSYNDVDVADGDTLTLKAPANNEIQFTPAIHNNDLQAKVCKIQAEKLNNTTSEIWSICTGLLCMSGYSSAPFTIAGNSTYDDLHIDFDVPADAPMGLFKITIYDTVNTGTRAFFFVKVFNKNSNGIAEAGQSVSLRAYPNPATSEVRIDYSTNNSNSRLVVFNMTGNKVSETALAESEGSVRIDISTLSAGVYMYGIENNGKISNIKKLVVK